VLKRTFQRISHFKVGASGAAEELVADPAVDVAVGDGVEDFLIPSLQSRPIKKYTCLSHVPRA
jgi:hypothetical protein